MAQDNNVNAFLALLRAGLWGDANENDSQNENLFEGLDWGEVQKLAEEQSVVGLVAAGFERLTAYCLPLTEKLTILGKCQLIEQRNIAMNHFVGELVDKMRKTGIYTILVKGQGIAQCYKRPLWRSSGDVDFLLDDENYKKAKVFLKPFASSVDKESVYNKHLGMTIGGYSVELHGNLRCGLSKKMDELIDDMQQEIFNQGKMRVWTNGSEPINLPAPNEDIVFIFTHFLKHFYKGGLGLRQICDWCRLLWTYRETIDVALLESRLRKMKLVSEWKAFGAFAVEYLGLPKDAMPLYEASDKWGCKANRILDFIIMSGNFGNNRDSSYWNKYPYLVRKAFSMKRRVGDLINHSRIFPMGTLRFCPAIICHGLYSIIRGE